MDTLKNIDLDVQSCSRCELRATATNPVCSCGEVGAKYMLIGEAPGREEDEKGVPFIGAAGRKLNKLIELAGIDINDCYFTNTVRCRPPENRSPRKKEIRACVEFLWREIRLVKPQLIFTLGATPLSLFSDCGISQMHGTRLEAEVPDTL